MLQMVFGYRHCDYRKCPTSFTSGRTITCKRDTIRPTTALLLNTMSNWVNNGTQKHRDHWLNSRIACFTCPTKCQPWCTFLYVTWHDHYFSKFSQSTSWQSLSLISILCRGVPQWTLWTPCGQSVNLWNIMSHLNNVDVSKASGPDNISQRCLNTPVPGTWFVIFFWTLCLIAFLSTLI